MGSEVQQVLKTPESANIEHISHFSDKFLELFNSEDYSDVTLIVDGERIPAHKIILAAQSHYFRALLFGGLKESSESEVELKVVVSAAAFKDLLKYIYTGRTSLSDKNVEAVLDINRLARLYGLLELEKSIVHYLCDILSIENVCSIYDVSLFDQAEYLIDICLEFMDNHAAVIIEHESFLELSYPAVKELVLRHSFNAPETRIFVAVQNWLQINPLADKESILSSIRLNRISTDDLLDIVRPSNLISSDAILNAIAGQRHPGNSIAEYRGKILLDENVADPKHGAVVLQGVVPVPSSSLLEDNDTIYDIEEAYTRHTITENENDSIVIQLGANCLINHIKMLLWSEDNASYSYYVEVSLDETIWSRVIDHRKYYCRSWQYLYFEPRMAIYIRIVGTECTTKNYFYVRNFQAFFKKRVEAIKGGFVVPSTNVATLEFGATVEQSNDSWMHYALLDGNTTNYNDTDGYTAHEVGRGSIVVQLGQPYIIDTMRLLLWDRDERWFSYYIEVSSNSKDWTLVVDKREEVCQSWQRLQFNPPGPIVYIKIVGTCNSSIEDFQCVHFECPAQLENHTKSS